MMADHRQDYTPTKMYVNGRRMVGDWTVDDAVEEYMRLHPDAEREAVRAELQAAADHRPGRSAPE